MRVPPVSEGLECKLLRVSEPPERLLAALRLNLSSGEAEALARSLLLPYVERALEAGGDEVYMALRSLVPLDPVAVLERIEAREVEEKWRDSLRLSVAQTIGRDSIEDALALIQSMDEAETRCWGLMETFSEHPELEDSQKEELLAQALLEARAIGNPAHRAVRLARLAEILLDRGERERAQALLDEGAKLARNLATVEWDGFARGAFAE
ncbi:MAG: hypothetical protein AB1486_21445 [Planctomycetota bacterium]